MDATRSTLLERVKHPDDESAWREFYRLYSPLIRRFARSRGLDADEADDVAQECMNILLKRMQTFDYSRDKGSFKNYLFTLANNNIKKRLMRNKPRLAASGELRTLEAKGEDLQNEWRQFWIKQHLAFCLKNIQHDFSDNSVTAFKLYVLKEWDVRKVCDTLGMTANQVYLAKSRIVRRLRKALADLTGETI